MIEVAIDARVTRRMSTGTRAYQRELLARLPAVAPDVHVTTFSRGENLSLDEFVGIPVRLARLRPQVVHYLTIFAPPVTFVPYVVTIHDLIHFRHAELFSRAPQRYYAVFGRRFARGAARLCVGDERTIEDCERYLGVPADRCRVVPLGYDPRMLDAPAFDAARPYVFYAGNHRPHKNLDTLFAAWRDLPPELEIDLRCTGTDRTGNAERYRRERGRLLFIGDLDEPSLWATYRGASAYVHPSLAEGFGIPMLEALAVGTPVIASDEAVPSIVRPFALTFPARDAATLGERLRAVLADERSARARAAEGARSVRAYTWDRFAAGIAAVYREVA